MFKWWKDYKTRQFQSEYAREFGWVMTEYYLSGIPEYALGDKIESAFSSQTRRSAFEQGAWKAYSMLPQDDVEDYYPGGKRYEENKNRNQDPTKTER
jgi:hypothetical protein